MEEGLGGSLWNGSGMGELKKNMSKMQVGRSNLRSGGQMKLHVDDPWVAELSVFAFIFPKFFSS